MSAVCRDTQPRPSLQAGHTHVIKSLPEIQVQTCICRHTQTQTRTHMQAFMDNDCKVRQKQTSDTQEDRTIVM